MFCSQSSEHAQTARSSSASVKIDDDKATKSDPASPPNTSGKAGCWFGNPRHPDLWTGVEGVSSADLLREEKHAEAHSLAMGLLDLVFTKHEQARNIITLSLSKKTSEFFLPTASMLFDFMFFL